MRLQGFQQGLPPSGRFRNQTDPLFLALAILLLLIVLLGLMAVQWTARTLRVSSVISSTSVRRGDEAKLLISVVKHCPLPTAPLSLQIETVPGLPTEKTILPEQGRSGGRLELSFLCDHVGVSRPGVSGVVVEDYFGLARKSVSVEDHRTELVSLPLTFSIGLPPFSPGKPGLGTMARASEDITSPMDLREWQQGDPMKRVHWKLSARKQELMVRKYEEPVLPDALVLLDCSRPPDLGDDQRTAVLRDTLLETAASMMLSFSAAGHNARLPLSGTHPVEVSGAMTEGMILEHIARNDFSEPERFERVLMQESIRLRRVGAAVVITARLNGRMVDAMARIRRLGPTIRLCLVTFWPDDPKWHPYVNRLLQAGVDVGFVSPN